MKKVFIIDGGPRKNMNTAHMIDAFIQGVESMGSEIEINRIRLYDYDFHGCYSCMLCKMKNSKFHDFCGRKDGITPVLQEVAYADGIVLASPIFFNDVTAQLKCFLERLYYPWLSYEDLSAHPPKQGVPSAIIYTMNSSTAEPEQMELLEQMFRRNEYLVGTFFDTPERVVAMETKQVKDYNRFEFTIAWAQAHDKWHDEHFAEEQRHAFEAGRRLAEKVVGR